MNCCDQKLIMVMHHKIQKAAKRYAFDHLQETYIERYEDTGTDALIAACRDYKEDGGRNFTSYIWQKVKFYFSHLNRSIQKEKKLISSVSIYDRSFNTKEFEAISETVGDVIVDPHSSPEDQYVAKEMVNRFFYHVDLLKNQRVSKGLRLRFLDEMTGREAAKTLGMSCPNYSTVMSKAMDQALVNLANEDRYV